MGGKFLETGSGVCVRNEQTVSRRQGVSLEDELYNHRSEGLCLYWNAIVPAVECLLSSSWKELVPTLVHCAPLLEALQKEPIDNPEALQMPL